jgi:molybdenum cofactor cytidylyltransferase
MLPPDIRRIHNPAFASGMASSLKAGLAALPPDAGAVLLMLGDMPAVRAQDIAKLIAAFDPDEGRGIIVPVHQGKRGHPVLFSRAYWPAMAEAEGDQGARQALIDNADAVCEVAIDHPGVLMDADTPESLSALRALMEP